MIVPEFIDMNNISIHTTKGDKLLSDINTEDGLFDYNNGNIIYPLAKYNSNEIVDSYKITFNDGRVGIYTKDDCLPIRNKLITLCDLINKYKCFEINKHSPIEYNYDVINIDDSYISGAMIVGGNRNIEYINIPLSSDQIISEICFKHFIKPYSILDRYITFCDRCTNVPIKWNEFFINIEDDNIPDKYRYAKIYNRINFIQGVFDTLVNVPIRYNDHVSFKHKSENIINQLRQMLWSIGVTSKLHEFESCELDMYIARGDLPKLFYNTFKKDKAIHSIDECYPHQFRDIHPLYIDNIQKYKQIQPIKLVFDKPTLFMASNFLPIYGHEG